MAATITEKSAQMVMRERSSVRKYQRGKKIPEDTLKAIFELAGRAPSSWNLQHWKYLVIEDQERKDRLLPIAYGQQQVSDCSAVVIVLGDTQANKNAEKVYKEAVESGYMLEVAKQRLLNNIDNTYENVEHIGVYEAIRNASLGAMQFMLAAKAFDLDTVPMGGFNADALRKELNIPDRYLINMMIPMGYAQEPAHQTSRFPIEEIVIRSFS